MLDPEKILAILISRYASELRETCLGVSETHGRDLNNRWVVPTVTNLLTSFDPGSVEDTSFDLGSMRSYSLERQTREQVAQLERKPGVSTVLGLLGGLPYSQIYGMARNADSMKGMLLDRVEVEKRSLLGLNPTGDERTHVEQNFYAIKPMQTQEYADWITKFSRYLRQEGLHLRNLAQFFADKTRIPFVGGRIKSKVDPLVQQYLGTHEKPNWSELPGDLQIVFGALVPAYLEMEKDIFNRRYEGVATLR